MTREEAIICLQGLLDNPLINKGSYLAQAIEMAIQALSQEPCDDAISRKDIQDYIAKYLSQYLYEDVRQAVEVIDAYIGDMPSVTQKSGKWKYVLDAGGFYICSECECGNDYADNYCPQCGAKMVEPQESEE